MSKQKINKSVQQTIPYTYCYRNGVIETKPGHFSRAYKLNDVNFIMSNQDEQERIFKEFEKVLNLFPATMNFQIFFHNHKADKRETLRNIHYRKQTDSLNNIRSELNEVLVEKISTGKSSIRQDKYLIISTKDTDAAHANQVLQGYDVEIDKIIRGISKETATPPISLEDRLHLLHDIYNQDDESVFGNTQDEEGKLHIDFDWMLSSGMTTKDMIAPAGISFDPKGTYFQVGKTYGRAMFLQSIPAFLSTEFIKDLTNLNVEMTVSIHYRQIDPLESRKMVRDQMRNIRGEIGDQQKHALQEGYSQDLIPADLENSLNSMKDLMSDIVLRDQRLFDVTIIVTVFASTLHQLDANCQMVTNTAKGYICPLKTLLYQQEEGLNSSLPLASNQIEVSRILTTESSTIFIPYTSQELFQREGLYYGVNQITRNVSIYNRMTGANYNGLVFGASGSGKSFLTKLEIFQVLARDPRNYVYVIDPQGEYGEKMLKALGQEAEEIVIAASSNRFLNPMDIILGEDSEENPIATKCDYMIGLVEMMANGQQLSPKGKSIVVRCVDLIYREYKQHIEAMRQRGDAVTMDRTAMPTLSKLYNELLRQEDPDAKAIADVVEMYATGKSFTTFAHQSNTDTNRRYVCYNIKDLGNIMKTIGLYVCLNDIYNKMIENSKLGLNTWIYVDEFWVLLQNPNSCNFVKTIWKTARKWRGVPTGITQNVEDMTLHSDAKAIIDNTSFVIMMNSSRGDQDALENLFRLNDNQLKYITNAKPGTGLIYTGATTIPFDAQYPKNSIIYKVADTSGKEKDNQY